MEQKTLIIVVAVIIVAVAVIAAAFVMAQNGDKPADDVPDTPDTPDTPDVPDTPDTPDTPDVPDTPDTPDVPEYRSTNTSGRLMIFGNANNDDYLDDEDLTVLQQIKGTTDFAEKHPLADANQDGAITDADIEMVKKMINRESMNIFFGYDSGKGIVAKEVSYPVKNFLLVGDDVSIALQSINATTKCKGVAVSDFDDPINAWVGELTRIGTKSTAADVAIATTVADADTVLITSAASRYVTNADAFELAGIKVLRMNLGTGTTGEVAANFGLLTMGYLLGLEDEANEVVKFSDDVISKVNDAVKDIADDKRAKAIVANRTANISGKSSEYYYIAQLAGAKNMIDGNESHTSFNVANGDDWLYALDVEYILHFTSLGYGDVDTEKTFNTYNVNFKLTDAYLDHHYYLMNANMPTAVCVAFSAECMYPELFESGFGFDTLDQYIKNFTCLPDTYNVKDPSKFFIMHS